MTSIPSDKTLASADYWRKQRRLLKDLRFQLSAKWSNSYSYSIQKIEMDMEMMDDILDILEDFTLEDIQTTYPEFLDQLVDHHNKLRDLLTYISYLYEGLREGDQTFEEFP